MTVEILFYIAVPVIVAFERFFKPTVVLLFTLSFLLYAFGESFLGFPFLMGKTFFEFLKITPIVWGWMFLLGVMAFKYYNYYSKYLRLFVLASVPIVFLILFDGQGPWISARDNTLGLFYFFFYSLFVLFLAFGIKHVTLNFDISYGVYIWHMVVINFLLVAGLSSPMSTLVLVVVLAFTSWYLIEKPALKLKKYSIRYDNRV